MSAHHGQVGLTRTPGGGATFVVRLPVRADSPTTLLSDEDAGLAGHVEHAEDSSDAPDPAPAPVLVRPRASGA